jgi:hypothetical protein
MLDMQWVKDRMNNAGSRQPAQAYETSGNAVRKIDNSYKPSPRWAGLAVGALVGIGIFKYFARS